MSRAATLLGGRVSYTQLPGGHRSGLEPVLLAAAVPARPGASVLEAGCGAGAALLCLAARVSGIVGHGIERDPALAALARDNAVANGFAGLAFEVADVETFRPQARFDHAIANPPWHDARGTGGTDAAREAARRGRPGLIAAWVTTLGEALRPRGTLSLVVSAGVVLEATAAMAGAGVGSIRLIPFWPHSGEAAKIVIVQGIRGGKSPTVLAPGLVLHEAGGRFTREAGAVLSGGAAIAGG